MPTLPLHALRYWFAIMLHGGKKSMALPLNNHHTRTREIYHGETISNWNTWDAHCKRGNLRRVSSVWQRRSCWIILSFAESGFSIESSSEGFVVVRDSSSHRGSANKSACVSCGPASGFGDVGRLLNWGTLIQDLKLNLDLGISTFTKWDVEETKRRPQWSDWTN